jgi:hypothetical protein
MSQQTYLPGTEPPHHDPDIEKALDAWFEARHQQKNAAADTKMRHSALLLQLQHAGRESYPYVDPSSGKKRTVTVSREPKVKTAAAPRWQRREKDAEIGEEVEPKEDRKVEKRRVSRASVEKEIDPFAGVRARMEIDGDKPLTATIEQIDKAKKPRSKVNVKAKRPR